MARRRAPLGAHGRLLEHNNQFCRFQRSRCIESQLAIRSSQKHPSSSDSMALGPQVRSGSWWPPSESYIVKRPPVGTSRPTVSYGLCHRPPVPRRACVEPRPLPQVGPRGDSLLACGVRQRRRPSRPERARGREAHWAVAASLPEKSQAASDSVACQQFRCLALNRRSRSPLT